MTQTIGIEQRAAEIAEYHFTGEWMPSDMDLIGTGSQRTVYVDYLTDTVYKIGNDGANRQEVRTLGELLADGVDYAPAATLWTVEVSTEDNTTQVVTVVAMPYLPDDGSVSGPYPVLPGAADLNPHGNVHAHGGQLWLIDAGGL